MLFKVSDLKLITKMVACSNEDDLKEMTKHLQKRQPDFFKAIQFVAADPRCYKETKFCILFCGIALEQAELISNEKFNKMPLLRLEIARRLIAQNKYSIDKQFVKTISSLEKHVLNQLNFDQDDIFWLKINIGAFIVLLDMQLEEKEEVIETFEHLVA